MSDCSTAIRTAVGDKVITEAEATDILTRMENLAGARAAEKHLRIDEALKEIAGELKAGEASKRIIDRRNTLLSITALRQQLRQVTGSNKLFIKSIYDSFENALTSQRSIEKKFLSAWTAKQEELGITDIVRNQKHSKIIHEEVFNTPGSPQVLPGELGAKLHEFGSWYRDTLRPQMNALMNRAGAYFPEHANYGFLQSYSKERLWKLAGRMDEGHKSRAKAIFMDLVNSSDIDERMFEGRDKSLFWENVFKNIYSGDHEVLRETNLNAFTGVHGSLANKLSSERLIWHNTAESQWNMNKAIGRGDYGEMMMHEIRRASRSVALMTEFGPNWEGTVKLLHSNAMDIAKNQDDIGKKFTSGQQTDALKGGENKLKAYGDILSGATDNSSNPRWSQWLENAIGWTHLAKMGSAVIASFGDKTFQVDRFMANGMSRLQAFGEALNLSKDPKVLRSLNVVANATVGSIQNRYGVGELKGAVSKANHAMHQWNQFNRWNDSIEGGTAQALSHWLGEHADLEFGALPEGLQRELGRSGITDTHWDAYRATAQSVDEVAGGLAPEAKKFVLLDKVAEAPDELVDALVRKNGWTVNGSNRVRARDELNLKLANYFTGQVSLLMNLPTLATKYITTGGGAQAGTLANSSAKLITVFKSFPITVALNFKRAAEEAGLFTNPKGWGKEQYSFIWQRSQLIAAASIAGYVSSMTQDLLRGRTPKRPFDENGVPNGKVWLDAMSKGGGLGIYGDFLFNEYDRQYKSVLGGLAGPIVGQLDPIGALFSGGKDYATGADANKPNALRGLGSEAFNIGVNNLPFGNLFYVRPILNAFIWWNVREMLSPGVLMRQEKNVRGLGYQDFNLQPSAIGTIPITEPGRKAAQIIKSITE